MDLLLGTLAYAASGSFAMLGYVWLELDSPLRKVPRGRLLLWSAAFAPLMVFLLLLSLSITFVGLIADEWEDRDAD